MTYTTTAYLLSHEGNFSNASRIGGGIIGPGGIGGIGALCCGLYVLGLFIIVDSSNLNSKICNLKLSSIYLLQYFIYRSNKKSFLIFIRSTQVYMHYFVHYTTWVAQIIIS